MRGQLLQEGWGAELGYPGIVLDLDGPAVGVQLFESSDLPGRWTRLDEFEGSGYRRTVTTATTAEGDLLASIYVVVFQGTAPLSVTFDSEVLVQATHSRQCEPKPTSIVEWRSDSDRSPGDAVGEPPTTLTKPHSCDARSQASTG